MTAITIFEISTADMPFNNMHGTDPKRRVIIAIRGAGSLAVYNLDLDTYVPGLEGVEGVLWSTTSDIDDSIGPSWDAQKTLTFQNAVAAGGATQDSIECGVICTLSE